MEAAYGLQIDRRDSCGSVPRRKEGQDNASVTNGP